jgi:hypothetical protein
VKFWNLRGKKGLFSARKWAKKGFLMGFDNHLIFLCFVGNFFNYRELSCV